MNQTMAKKIIRHGLEMREFFNTSKYDIAQWFPGHMATGLRNMQNKLKSVDCIIEVHDARIPLTGRNPLFRQTLLGIKPHILILNKVDLANIKQKSGILKALKNQGITEVIFTNSKKPDSRGIKSILPTVSRVITESDRYNRADEQDYSAMIIGIPNVGKSSVINALRAKHLRRGKATAVGDVPGITRNVLERIKISEDPKVYLIDTPGILSPHIADVETGLKLALVNTIKEHLVGEDIIADYLLFWLNSNGYHNYVDTFKLEAPLDDIQQMLIRTAFRNNWIRQVKTHNGYETRPDMMLTATQILRVFRAGKLGKVMLDDFISN